MEKSISYNAIEELVGLLKANRQRIVFTNGCFDLLHPGHIDYLQKAKNLGDALFVGINSDASVSKLKGENRPINNLNDRITMLSALEAVDFILPFEEDTPIKLIERIKPDILVKGGDYLVENIVGYDFVSSYDGQVLTLDFLEGYSSTGLIKKIKSVDI